MYWEESQVSFEVGEEIHLNGQCGRSSHFGWWGEMSKFGWDGSLCVCEFMSRKSQVSFEACLLRIKCPCIQGDLLTKTYVACLKVFTQK